VPQLCSWSPLGWLTVSEEGGAIVALDWGRGCEEDETPLLLAACDQLAAWFAGERRDFDLPLAPAGTDFQQRVWAELGRIPWGTVRSYGAVAAAVGSSPRAVGTACGRNPIPIIVPCHRVVASGGRLGGYSGDEGVETKRRLLGMEGVRLPPTVAR